MNSKITFRNWMIALIFPLVFVLSACEQNTASFAAQRRSHAVDQTALNDQTAQMIKRLEVAKELDESNSFDPDVRPTRREDFMVKAAKADRTIRELRLGFPVSSEEVEDALEIPPRHLTPEERAQLVNQLKHAQALDDQRAQEILIYYRDDEPVERDQFGIQSERAAAIAKDLQLGESVHWDDIKQALYVPGDPL